MKKLKIKFINSLSFTLMFWFLTLTFVPLSVSTFKSYNHSVNSLEKAAKHELEQSSLINYKFIKNWFYYREVDISNWSNSIANIDFISALHVGLKKSGLSINKYLKSDEYLKLISSKKQDLLTIKKKYDYIIDMFVIDTNGNILYTVSAKEELGKNLFSPKYVNTRFTQAYKQTIKDKKVHFSDLELNSPLNDKVAGFFTAPLIDKNNKVVGSLAMKIKLDRIFALFEDKDFMHYLVGEDAMLRSNISPKYKALKYKLDTEQFRLWYEEYSLNQTNVNIKKEERIFKYSSVENNEVYGVHQNINILGVKWVLISEVDKKVILSSIAKVQNEIAISLLITMLIILFIAFIVTDKIASPIIKLYKANLDFAKGKRDLHVDTKNNDEIGLLSNAFNQMVKQIKTNELEITEQKYALDTHSSVAVTGIKGNITYANDKFVELSGYSKKELLGQNHRIVNSKKHSKNFWNEMYKTISTGKAWHGEIRNMSKNGNYYWVDTTIVPFMNENNKPKSYIAIHTDITYKKEAEFKLLKANELAQESVKLKNEFLASMSHEIRTPMNGVIGMLGLLLKGKLDDTQKHQASLAQSSATALLGLINDILDFSKVEAGKMELEYIDFDLRDELGKFSEVMAFKAQEKGVELFLDVTGVEKNLVNGDPGRIRQVLSNIVGNSVKFTSEGYVLIKAVLNTDDEQNPRLMVEMSDTGIGIPENKISTLFDSFSQVDASTTRKYGGTGLGLAIVKKLCSLMDGKVEVYSDYGNGSTFSIDIAIGIPDKAKLVKPYNSVEGKKIFLVDTSEYSIDVLKSQLDHWGMKVSSTCRAKEALESFKKEKFDIVFLDMFIADMDIRDFVKEIRQNKELDDMKIVVMTSLKERGDALEYKSIGIDSSFPKPVTTNDFFRALGTMYENTIVDEQEIEDSVRFTNTNILLVEDNLTNQLVANGILEGFNLEADVANNGVEALEILNANEKKYDIILMDCQMPKMDGYETTEAIRDEKAGYIYKDIPIVAMTANVMRGDKEKCTLAGMDDYIAKPIDPQILENTLKKYLSYTEV